MTRSSFGQHAVRVAEHFNRVDGANDVLVQRQFIGRHVFGVGGDGNVVDEHERQRHGGHTHADGHQVRGHEAKVDDHDAVGEHAQYGARGERAADHAVLDGAPFLGRGVGHVRVHAVEEHWRPARERERGRLHGGGERGRHGPVDDAIQRQRVRRYLTGDRQQYERPAATAVPVAPRPGEQHQHDGYEVLEQRLPTVDGSHHVLRQRLVVALRAYPLGYHARRVARLVQQQVRAQAVRVHHRD